MSGLVYGVLSGGYFALAAFHSKDIPSTTSQLIIGIPSLLALIGVLHVVSGVGLLQGKGWGARLGQALGFGTILAVGIWYLFQVLNPHSEQATMIYVALACSGLMIAYNFLLKSVSTGKSQPPEDDMQPERWYVALANREKFGPYSRSQLEELVEDGRLHQTDMLLREGDARWVESSSLHGLFPPARVEEKGLEDRGKETVQDDSNERPHRPTPKAMTAQKRTKLWIVRYATCWVIFSAASITIGFLSGMSSFQDFGICLGVGAVLGLLAIWLVNSSNPLSDEKKPLYELRAKSNWQAIREGVVCSVLAPVVVGVFMLIANLLPSGDRTDSGFTSSRRILPFGRQRFQHDLPIGNPAELKAINRRFAFHTVQYWNQAVVEYENNQERASATLLDDPENPAKAFRDWYVMVVSEQQRVRNLKTQFVDADLQRFVEKHLESDDLELTILRNLIAIVLDRKDVLRDVNDLTDGEIVQFLDMLRNPSERMQLLIAEVEKETEQSKRQFRKELTKLRTRLQQRHRVKVSLPKSFDNPGP